MSDDLDIDENDINGPALNDDLAKLAELLKLKDASAKAAAAAEIMYKRHRDAVYERMDEEKVTSVRYNGQLFVRNEPTWYATVQDRAALQAWARENAPAILVTREQDALLNKLVRSAIEDGRDFPPGLSAYPRKVVAVRK